MKLFPQRLKYEGANNANDGRRPQIHMRTTPRDADEPCEDSSTELMDAVVLHQLGLSDRLLPIPSLSSRTGCSGRSSNRQRH